MDPMLEVERGPYPKAPFLKVGWLATPCSYLDRSSDFSLDRGVVNCGTLRRRALVFTSTRLAWQALIKSKSVIAQENSST